MILVPEVDVWVGPVGRVVPGLGGALGRRLVVSEGMGRPIVALRLARKEDGEAMIAEIARLTLGEWKTGADGTLTLVQSAAARNIARLAQDRANRAAWAATAARRRAQLEAKPDWRKLSGDVRGLGSAFDATRDPRPIWRFTARTPEGRFWNRLAIHLPLAELARIPFGAYSDRGGSAVRTLPIGASNAVRSFLAEWAAWHDVRRSVTNADEPDEVVILDERTLAREDAPVNVDRIALRWRSTPRQIDLTLKLYNRSGSAVTTIGHAIGRDESDDPPRSPKRETHPYPPIPLAQVREHTPYADLPDPGPALVEAAWDVLRNDPTLPPTLPLLAEAERRDRSLVALRPDLGADDFDGRFDLFTPAEWTGRGLTEQNGILTIGPDDPLRREAETVGRSLLDSVIRVARRPTANVSDRSAATWATREFADDTIAVTLPQVAWQRAQNSAPDGNRRWWILHGGLTPAQRRLAETKGLPLASLSLEAREWARRIVIGGFDSADSETELSDARSDPVLRWPDGWRTGTLRLKTTTERFLMSESPEVDRMRLDGPHFALYRAIAKDPKSFGAPEDFVVPDFRTIRKGERETVQITMEIEDLRWSARLESDMTLSGPVAFSTLDADWKAWLAKGEAEFERRLRENRSKRPPPSSR